MHLFTWILLSQMALANEPSDSTEPKYPSEDTDEDLPPTESDAENSVQSVQIDSENRALEQEDTERTPNQDQSEDSEEPIESLTSPELMTLMEGIRQDLENIENVPFESEDSTDIEDQTEDEPFNYKGNFEYSYALTLWESDNKHVFHTGQVSGDPQYYFNRNGWGPTLGICFQVAETKKLNKLFIRDFVGLTTGLQIGDFRLNTAGSWMWEQYFAQSETDRSDGFVTYQYDEVPAMSGVLWENTLTYSPDDLDLGIQASVGFPFQVNGSRNMGSLWTDSWQVRTLVNISFLQLGYTKIVYPNHSIQRVQVGSGILF